MVAGKSKSAGLGQEAGDPGESWSYSSSLKAACWQNSPFFGGGKCFSLRAFSWLDEAPLCYLPANAGDLRDTGLIPGLRRSPKVPNANPLQYSCLENPMDRGACWATVHGAAKSWTQLKQLSAHARTHVMEGNQLYSKCTDLNSNRI